MFIIESLLSCQYVKTDLHVRSSKHTQHLSLIYQHIETLSEFAWSDTRHFKQM